MLLSRQKVLLLVLVSGIACRDSTGPETVSAFFTLQAIDGRALPTYIAATPGPTTTVISSSLILDKSGRAVVIEHRNEMFRGDVTDTTTYAYQLHGTQIVMLSPVVCVAITTCPIIRTGTILPLVLNLVINPTSTGPHIVYEYRGIGLD
jgi:hypothetical protein